MNGLLRIGEMARLGGVSVKALRFYDEQGLLRPEHVDPQSGYRYYTPEQAKTLTLILNMRMVDFSIAEIAALLDSDRPEDESFQKALELKRAELKQAQSELARKIKLAEIMAQSVQQAGSNTPPAFKLTAIDEERVYSLRQTVPHLGGPVTEMFERAESFVAQNSARALTEPFLIYHDPPTQKSDLEVEVCIPVSQAGPRETEFSIVPGCGFACAMVYGGGYFKTEPLFEKMQDWIAQAGLSATGPLRERYHRFGADQEDYRLPAKMIARSRSDYLTELQIPISFPADHEETA